MKMLIAVAVVVLILPSTATASTKELDDAVMRTTHFGIQPMPKTDRMLLAKAALEYWKSFDSRIPRNPPSAEEWLKKEMSTIDNVRISSVVATPEYALKSLAETSEDCVRAFDLIVNHPSAQALTELYLWTKTLRCYKSPNDLLIYLKQAGLSDGRWDGVFSIEHFTLFHDTVTGPIANAIIEEGQNIK